PTRRSSDLATSHGAILPAKRRSVVAYGVSRTTDGADDVRHPVLIDRLTQPPDMDVDGALVDIDRFAPDLVEQLGPREHAARMLHQEFEQAELRGAQPDLGAAAMNAVLLAVEHDLTDSEHGGKDLRLGAAQECFHASHEFRHRERLDEIVVSSGLKAPDPVAFLAA